MPKFPDTMFSNIDAVTASGQCTQCGTCYGICPRRNIKFSNVNTGEYVFNVKDVRRCGHCNLCIRVCPGHFVNFIQLYSDVFGCSPSLSPLGVFRESLISCANNTKTLSSAASGGVVTTLLQYALQIGLISGALVVTKESSNPLEIKVVLAHSEKEILDAAQSKYQPVPMNIGLRQILKNKGKYAVVGLPCHLHGIRKAERLLPKLKKHIAFRLGLFCINNARITMTHYLLHRLGVSRKDVIQLRYREKYGSNGWPGGMRIITRNGEEFFIPYKDYQYAQTLFAPPRCDACPDFANELADIALGDAHLDEFKQGKPYKSSDGHILDGRQGWNLVLVRTACGKKLWDLATNGKAVTAHKIDPKKTIISQNSGIYYKKVSYFARMRLRALLRQKHPYFKGLNPPEKILLLDFVKPVISIFFQLLLSSRAGVKLLCLIPDNYMKMKLGIKHKGISQKMRLKDKKHLGQNQ